MGFGRATGKSHLAAEINGQLDAYRASALAHTRNSSRQNESKRRGCQSDFLGMAFGQETFVSTSASTMNVLTNG
jgi:ABC-type phosphate/phosphonate transport system ATPase subunit